MLRFVLSFFCIVLVSSQDISSAIADIFGDQPQNNVSLTPTKQVVVDNGREDASAPVKEAIKNTTQDNFVQNIQNPNKVNGNSSCVTDTGEPGRCVEYYACDSSRGEGTIDQHFKEDLCQLQSQTCCPLAFITTADGIEQQPERPGCGWRNPNGVGPRMVGLTNGEANFGEFPWVVAILRTEPEDEKNPNGSKREVYVGAGSLIHPSVVLTTAHSVAKVSGLRVRAGEWDTRTDSEPHPSQDRDVVDMKVHEDYISGTLYYDVAVLFLASPMNLAPNVGLACLAPPKDRPRVGTRCFVAGWGKEQYGKQDRSHVILRKTDLPVVDRNTCQTKLRSTRLGNLFELHSSFMCAGGEPSNDACRGDSGSPLVCPIEFEDNRYQQNGIVAWGVGCGEDGTPGVYVDVAKVRPWIDDAVAGRIYDPKVYTV